APLKSEGKEPPAQAVESPLHRFACWQLLRTCTRHVVSTPAPDDRDVVLRVKDPLMLASYRSPKTVIAPSLIAGRGLFADAAIATGEIVCVKGGHLLPRAEFEKYKAVANEADLQIADDLFLAPVTETEFESVMMFLNHSCEPNVGIQGQIVFVA